MRWFNIFRRAAVYPFLRCPTLCHAKALPQRYVDVMQFIGIWIKKIQLCWNRIVLKKFILWQFAWNRNWNQENQIVLESDSQSVSWNQIIFPGIRIRNSKKCENQNRASLVVSCTHRWKNVVSPVEHWHDGNQLWQWSQLFFNLVFFPRKGRYVYSG